MISVDYYIQSAIKGGFDKIKANTELCRDFLGGIEALYPSLYNDAVQYFANNTPSIMLGWSAEAPPANTAIVCITLGENPEIHQPISGFLDEDDEYDSQGNITAAVERYGTFSRSVTNCTVYANNQDLCIWVAAAVKWCLLAQRFPLEELGFAEQRLSMQDLGPDQRWLPQYVFRRLVSLVSTHVDVVSTIYTEILKDVEVFPSDPEDAQHPFLP